MGHDAGQTLLLWDVDGTLISNGGVSRENYALAFELLVGRSPHVSAQTGGRTDVSIMRQLLLDNDTDPALFSWSKQESMLAKAGRLNKEALGRRGKALPGAETALRYFAAVEGVYQSVLTGNIEQNAYLKLQAFDLHRWINFETGAFGSESAVRADLVRVAKAKAETLHGFDPLSQAVILVGDSERDVEAGRDGGAWVIAVATGEGTEDELAAAGADLVLPDLADLSALVAAVDVMRGPRSYVPAHYVGGKNR